MANVFNTFSFNKWADTKKEEEIDKETTKRRHQQIKRLKEKLRRERELREAGLAGQGDVDLEALIEALQSGEAINSEANPFANWHNGRYEAGKGGGAGQAGMAGENAYGKEWENPGEIDLPDDYILSEIRRYKNNHGGSYGGYAQERAATATVRAASARAASARPTMARAASAVNPHFNWQYNRRIQELMQRGQVHSEPTSRSSSASRPRSRTSSAHRSSSAGRRI